MFQKIIVLADPDIVLTKLNLTEDQLSEHDKYGIKKHNAIIYETPDNKMFGHLVNNDDVDKIIRDLKEQAASARLGAGYIQNQSYHLFEEDISTVLVAYVSLSKSLDNLIERIESLEN